MTYAVQADLSARYGDRELIQVTDKTVPQAGAINTATVTKACTDTDGEINSRLGVRYVVPITGTVPDIVVDVACRIARYKLHEDRASEKIRKDYEDAMKFLADVAAGRAVIPDLSPIGTTTPGVTAGGNIAVCAPAPRFTDEVLDSMP